MEKQYFEKEVNNYEVTFYLIYSTASDMVGGEYVERIIDNERIDIVSVIGELGEVTEGVILNEIEQELLSWDFESEIDLF